MKKGDILLVDFPFTDLTQTKRRPALLLAADAVDVTVAFITSKLAGQHPHDVLLQPSARSGLKVPSLVRTLKLAALDQRLVRGRIGELTAAELQQVDAGLRLGLRL